MKKTIIAFSFLISTASVSVAQTVNDAVKLLQYGKSLSAKEMLQKMDNKEPNVIYWLGQTLIAKDEVAAAKELYQKALQSGVNDGLMYIGMAHIDLLQGGDWNSASQKFESAITTTTETRGKNKGKAPAYIYNAIGRANCIGHLVADGSSKFGNVDYAIEKLKIAKDIDATNTDCLIYMGLCYRKMGGEFGGDAQKAYTEALSRNPNLAQANHLIGKIYMSQSNKPLMDQYFDAAIANDVTYAPVYLDYYNYNADKDVPVAKNNIEKYLKYADKDCNNDYFYADYLFRAGNYQASLAKAKELENTDCKNRVPVLYAYNYDRLNDSIQAKANIDKYLATAAPDKILVGDYDIAIKIASRFAGQENQAIGYINKLLAIDNSKNMQLQYLSIAGDLCAKAKNYTEQIKTIQKLADVKGATSELDYYKMSVAAQNAKDYVQAIDIAKKYMTAFPDKSQPITFYRKAALGLDPDSSKGLSIQPLTDLNLILEKDIEKNRKSIFNNQYYMLVYYAERVKDYTKANEVLDKMLVLYPTAGEENKFILDQKENLKKMMNKPKPTTPPAKPTEVKKK
jgi:hypothetical protein